MLEEFLTRGGPQVGGGLVGFVTEVGRLAEGVYCARARAKPAWSDTKRMCSGTRRGETRTLRLGEVTRSEIHAGSRWRGNSPRASVQVNSAARMSHDTSIHTVNPAR